MCVLCGSMFCFAVSVSFHLVLTALLNIATTIPFPCHAHIDNTVKKSFAAQVSALCDALSPGFGGPWAGGGDGAEEGGPFAVAVAPFKRLNELVSE
jgi:hypothetical protein